MQARPSTSPAEATRSAVYEVPWWKWLLLLPVAGIFWVWSATLRVRTEFSPEELERVRSDASPILFFMWHNGLFVMPLLMQRYRRSAGLPFHAIVSASRDGAVLSAFFRLVGFAPLRGSSSRLGSRAARGALRAVRDGGDLGITVDGPRGPIYRLKPGAAMMAMQLDKPILLAVPVYESAWRARSWDRFFFPKPFSRVTLRSEILESYRDLMSDPAEETDRMAVAAALEERMLRLSRGTDRLMGI